MAVGVGRMGLDPVFECRKSIELVRL
jgi:hypothetical protein